MSSKLLMRTRTALVLALILGVALYLGGVIFLTALFVVSGIASREYHFFYKSDNKGVFHLMVMVIGLIYYLGLYFHILYALPLSLCLLFFISALYGIIIYPKIETSAIQMSMTGFIYTYVFASGFYLLRVQTNGLLWTLFIIIVVISFDSFSYVFGKLFGKKKIAPKLSPKKTIAGFIGGFTTSVVIGTIFSKMFLIHTIWYAILLSILIALAAFLGDLFESHLKRSANVKDSGDILPGHGGILDRFDSLLFTAGVAYLIGLFL